MSKSYIIYNLEKDIDSEQGNEWTNMQISRNDKCISRQRNDDFIELDYTILLHDIASQIIH